MVAVEVAGVQATSTVWPTMVLWPKASKGQEALTPSHISAGSQAAPDEGLHTVPGLPGVLRQPDCGLHPSTVQALASSQLSVAPPQVCSPAGSVRAMESTQ